MGFDKCDYTDEEMQQALSGVDEQLDGFWNGPGTYALSIDDPDKDDYGRTITVHFDNVDEIREYLLECYLVDDFYVIQKIDNPSRDKTRALKHAGCKIVVFVPEQDFQDYLDKINVYTINRIGDYINCMSWMPVTGSYVPVDNANPYIGEINQRAVVNEMKLEMQCDFENVHDVMQILCENHPYERPEIDIYQIYDDNCYDDNQFPSLVKFKKQK